MKKDLRVQSPLWNILGIVILVIAAYGVTHSFPIEWSKGKDGAIEIYITSHINWQLISAMLLSLIYLPAYAYKFRQHNKLNPQHKVSMFSIQPPEYLEEDEMMRTVTQRATQKVYTFISFALPLATALFFIPMNRFWYIVIILLIAIIQNLMYYFEIRKYVKEDKEEVSEFS
ncbi:hypothetical protein JFL43_01300 [Viridibacillus sp. YIM B01967]|uniref:Uncharacterized protein n=1 Tax=Viridibacillus soli TaxID=2798301 RepID=A0ABS1H286_9BACL|nr:hypothetical protein [Viridibacillus soli]MBK3493525.1 hypothetical protein [Viridibacillus soli]